MRRSATRFLVWTVIGMVFLGLLPGQAFGHHDTYSDTLKFGETPIDLVRDRAAIWLRTANVQDLTTDEMMAMMLAVTWGETQRDDAWDSPSPQTMGRSDFTDALYADGNPDIDEQRDYFHAGVGAWQIDSSGGDPYFSSTGAVGSVDTWVAANLVAQVMIMRWQQYSNLSDDPAQRRSKVWAKWFACSDFPGDCEHRYLQMLDSNGYLDVGGTLIADSTVTRYGGAVWTTCSYIFDVSNTFSCLEVDPSQAEGNLAYQSSSWSSLPLTKTFYTYDSGGYEYRHWKKWSSPAYQVDWNASRPLGQDVRTSVSWNSSTYLCVQGNCN